MRFQIASDLHLEMLVRFPGYRVIEPAPEAHALILAGDIHSHTHAIRSFSNWPVPVFYVHGNHEPTTLTTMVSGRSWNAYRATPTSSFWSAPSLSWEEFESSGRACGLTTR